MDYKLDVERTAGDEPNTDKIQSSWPPVIVAESVSAGVQEGSPSFTARPKILLAVSAVLGFVIPPCLLALMNLVEAHFVYFIFYHAYISIASFQIPTNPFAGWFFIFLNFLFAAIALLSRRTRPYFGPYCAGLACSCGLVIVLILT